MSHKHKEREARRQEAQRRASERAELRAETTGRGFSKLASFFTNWARMLLSNLRFSLSLRIAIYSGAQLLRTTFFFLLVFTVVFAVALLPTVDRTMDAILVQTPSAGLHYTPEQLERLPVHEAYLLTEPYPDSFEGFMDAVRLAFSQMDSLQGLQVLWYRNTVRGGLVVAFSLDEALYVYGLLFWALLCFDLYRVVYFLRHRYRLNKTVLKPIADMTQAAETLSANNLSNRINIAGTKNELKDLAAVINSMLDRIEHSYNSQKQFVSDASHELRTPIAVIQGYASMLERWGKTDKEVLDEGITAIAQETASMKELVERLLFLARHDKKTLMLEMEVFDPAEIMSAVHRDAKLLSTVHTFELAPLQHSSIRGDKGMLKQLMRILVDNAIKYTPTGGKVTLGLANSDKDCILSVSDTGQGMSAEELPRIFDRFYRSDKARKVQSSGHGLGLSIARIIVVAHGGRMTVRSKEGEGTTFLVRLPIVQETA